MERRLVSAAGSWPLCIYFIRHGETTWSLAGRHTSWTNIPLTERGEESACHLRERFRDQKFSHILTSASLRAQKTCELAGLASTAEIEPDLAEWNYGEYEGRRSVDIRHERPGWNIFQDGCLDGELPDQVGARADRLIARLRTQQGSIALFSHGQFGCVFAARWIGLPALAGQHFSLGTASVSVLGYDPHHSQIPVIAHWNAYSQDSSDLGRLLSLDHVGSLNGGGK